MPPDIESSSAAAVARPSKTSRELARAVDDDQRRAAVDAAKKRAVAQRADYDTFKKLVSVAHLKPVGAPSTGKLGTPSPAWALDPCGLQAAAAAAAAAAAKAADASNSTTPATPSATAAAAATPRQPPPGTQEDFARVWRRECATPADRFRLLQACGPAGLARAFRVEVPPALLGEALAALRGRLLALALSRREAQALALARPLQEEQGSSSATSSSSSSSAGGGMSATAACAAAEDDEEEEEVLRLLHGLTSAGRFELSARLLSPAARAAAAEVCDLLAAATTAAATKRGDGGLDVLLAEAMARLHVQR